MRSLFVIVGRDGRTIEGWKCTVCDWCVWQSVLNSPESARAALREFHSHVCNLPGAPPEPCFDPRHAVDA